MENLAKMASVVTSQAMLGSGGRRGKSEVPVDTLRTKLGRGGPGWRQAVPAGQKGRINVAQGLYWPHVDQLRSVSVAWGTSA